MQVLTSVKNPQVAAWRQLHNREGRLAAGAFLVEGAKMVAEALEQEVTALVVSQDRQEDYAPLIARCAAPCYLVSEGVLAAICDAKTPQGIAAILRLPASAAQLPRGPYLVALDGVQDPGNVGTILRTADAAGFSGAILSRTCADPYGGKCLRATMGSIFRIRPAIAEELADCLASLRSAGYSILSSQLDGAPFYRREAIAAPLCLVIGSEGSGVSEAIRALATHRLALPMRGGAESLNAAVAAGIMMYDLTRAL